MTLGKLHHVAIICSDYRAAKEFYVEKLGLPLTREVYRPERRDYILTLLAGDVEVSSSLWKILLSGSPIRKPGVCGIWLSMWRILSLWWPG